MKKLFTLAIAASACLGAGAESLQYLSKEVEANFSDERTYLWNDKGQLMKIETRMDYDIDIEFVYNDKGQIILHNQLQDLGTGTAKDPVFVKCAYIEYTYNEQGLLATRTNFNSTRVGDDPAQRSFYESATYHLSYDADGRLVKSTGIFANQTEPFSNTEYTYNEKGLLTKVDVQSIMFGEVSGSTTELYTYDENDRLIEIEAQSVDAENKQSVVYYLYTWDEDGNVETISTTNDKGEDPYYKIVFTYSDVPAAQCVYPVYPEQQFGTESYYDLSAHQMELKEEYGVGDDNTLGLMYSWQLEYQDGEGDYDGIATVSTDKMLAAWVNGDMLMGLDGARDMRIFDINGRMVKSVPAVNGAVSLNGLAEGTYIVTTSAGATKIIR